LFFSNCEHCERSFPTKQGLDNHQSRPGENHPCHRAKIIRESKEKSATLLFRNQLASKVTLFRGKSIPDVSEGPHPKGKPIDASQKKCVLNLFQSFINDGLDTRKARIETANRLQISERSITQIVKEKIALGNVSSNSKNRSMHNAYEKLSDEEEIELRKMVSTSQFFRNRKRLQYVVLGILIFPPSLDHRF